MYNYEYKEKDYAEKLLEKGFLSNHIKHELKILVKYYKELGHKPKERKELIYKFCEKNLEGYDRVTHFRMINSILSYGSNKNNKLIQIDSIEVTKQELDYIDGLDLDQDYKKIVFTVLVMDKLSKKYNKIKHEEANNENEHYFGGEFNYKKLIKHSKVTLKRSNTIHKVIHELADKGLVEIRMRGLIKLLFIYDIPEDDNVRLTVNTFDNIGLYYDLYVGVDKVKRCECCGTPIKVKSNRSKYCKPCFDENRSKQNRENFKKWYDKQISNQLEKR